MVIDDDGRKISTVGSLWMRLRRRPIVLLLLSGIWLLASPVASQTREPPGLDAEVEAAMRRIDVPGVVVAVVKNDSVVFVKGYGFRNVEQSKPVDGNTVFAIGSASKAFTVTLLGMLSDEGKLQMDAPVTRYLPWFQLYDPYVTRELTVRDLVTHRAGLDRVDPLWSRGGSYTRREVAERLRYVEPSYSFRYKMVYNNEMFLIAGMVAEAVGGKSWDDLVRERIFQPLGMDRSGTNTRGLDTQQDVAPPYAFLDGQNRRIAWRNIENMAPAGAINASALDVTKWMRLHLGGGSFAGRRLLSAAFSRDMQTSQTAMNVEQWKSMAPDSHLMEYGMGWFLNDHQGRLVVQHAGGIDGFSSEILLIPEEHLGVVVLSNLEANFLVYPLAYHLVDAFLGVPVSHNWADEAIGTMDRRKARGPDLERRLAAARVSGTHPTLALDRYAGRYTNKAFGDATVTREGDGLVFRFNGMIGSLQHYQYDTFRATYQNPMDSKAIATFYIGPSGTVERVNVERLGEFTRQRDKP